MKILSIIPHRYWRNRADGRTASFYGASPWTSQQERDANVWYMASDGFTFEMDNGTIGIATCKPFASESEAQKYMEAFNARDWEKCRAIKYARENPNTYSA